MKFSISFRKRVQTFFAVLLALFLIRKIDEVNHSSSNNNESIITKITGVECWMTLPPPHQTTTNIKFRPSKKTTATRTAVMSKNIFVPLQNNHRKTSSIKMISSAALLLEENNTKEKKKKKLKKKKKVVNDKKPSNRIKRRQQKQQQQQQPKRRPRRSEKKKKFLSYPFEYGTELTLRVESLSSLGMGVCRTALLPSSSSSVKDEDAAAATNTEKNYLNKNNTTEEKAVPKKSSTSSSWVIFVPYTIPDEVIKIRIVENTSSYSIGEVMDILERSPERQEEDTMCSYFGTCGGCQYQHIKSITTQRYYKTLQVQDCMERIGKFTSFNSKNSSSTTTLTYPEIKPTIGTDDIWNYRSKLTPHYSYSASNSNKINSNDGIIIGFESNNNTLIDVSSCRIATNSINEEYTRLRHQLKQERLTNNSHQQQKYEDFTTTTLLLRDSIDTMTSDNSDGTELYPTTKSKNVVVTDPNVYVTNKVGGNHNMTFRFRAGNFFQTNPYVLDIMISHVIDAATTNTNYPMTHFIDCYCGSGLFTISMAASSSASSNLHRCVGIEINEDAIRDANYNAKLNSNLFRSTTTVEFMAASAQAIFSPKKGIDVSNFPRNTTVVMIDPPRKGCSNEFIQQLLKYRPQRILYMSCNVNTQARDARNIILGGGGTAEGQPFYKITSVQPFDLFPQTRHIECLMVFDKI